MINGREGEDIKVCAIRLDYLIRHPIVPSIPFNTRNFLVPTSNHYTMSSSTSKSRTGSQESSNKRAQPDPESSAPKRRRGRPRKVAPPPAAIEIDSSEHDLDSPIGRRLRSQSGPTMDRAEPLHQPTEGPASPITSERPPATSDESGGTSRVPDPTTAPLPSGAGRGRGRPATSNDPRNVERRRRRQENRAAGSSDGPTTGQRRAPRKVTQRFRIIINPMSFRTQTGPHTDHEYTNPHIGIQYQPELEVNVVDVEGEDESPSEDGPSSPPRVEPVLPDRDGNIAAWEDFTVRPNPSLVKPILNGYRIPMSTTAK